MKRNFVFEKLSKGFSQSQIAEELKLHPSTISLDAQYLREEAQDNLRNHIENRLPQEYDKTLFGLNSILKEAWIMSEKAANQREKHAALSLAKECYSVRLDLLTNAGVINEAIDFVKRKQEKKEESNDIDDELEVELELEQEKETTEQ